MKPWTPGRGTSAHSLMMTRLAGIFLAFVLPFLASAQGGDAQLRTKADALFNERRFAEAMPLYSQLVSLSPSDRTLNYRFGTTLLFVGEDKEKAIGHLKFATESPAIEPAAWYWLGRAYHLNYRFKEALVAYQKYRGVADKKTLLELPAEAFEQQCRNGQKLLSKLKDITVRSKVEVAETEFFRFYDLSDIGGRIVVSPDELKTALDKKNKLRSLVYLPDKGGTIYFSSYGKDGRTGLDIYRTELLPDGKFATPEKLAGFINTEFDDDYAFMHPDGKTFYFSSKGHTSMGGYDVFRATYDRGMDAFGRPENMDFAVNTPDDDIFYMVDAEQKEACFASGRSSRQGKLHVYRVGTTQTPLIITVLRGTYASEFDANDRKARIVVEDALTREQVADVRTDINGSYVLALPRSGKFRFLVECGPTGKTHSGTVDVPRSDSPKAYRQELTLTKQGDLERLMIRNYFDEPLDGDIIAMALEEIKRRARLDVTGERAPVAEVTPKEEAPTDVLTQAGFAGNLDRADVVRLAQEDAAEQNANVKALEDMSAAAYAMAIEAVNEAERNAKEAEVLVAKAAAMSNEDERNATMVQAASLRQRAREAELRAQAAYKTGRNAEDERLTKRQEALVAEKLATDLQTTLTAKRDREALEYLTALKARMDFRSGPTGRMDLAERTRRAVVEQEKEAARALQQANAKRIEENELTDRLNRLRREQDDARSKAKKDELAKEIATYREQLEHLNKESEAAFAKARVLERETAVMRGNAGLTRHLSTSGSSTGTELEADQVAALERRISASRSRTEGLPIDERFDAQLPLRSTDMENRSFAWDRSAAAAWEDAERAATLAMQRNTEGDADRMAGRTTQVAGGADRERKPGEAQEEPFTQGADSTTGNGTGSGKGTTQPGVGGDDATAQGTRADRSAASNDINAPRATTGVDNDGRTGTQDSAEGKGADGVQGTASESGGRGTIGNLPTDGAADANAAVAAAKAEQDLAEERNAAADAARRKAEGDAGDSNAGNASEAGSAQRAGTVGAPQGTRSASTTGTDGTAREGQGPVVLSPEQIRNQELTESGSTQARGIDATDDAASTFLVENEIAEQRQLLSAERDRTKRENIQARIDALEASLEEKKAAEALRQAEGAADTEQNERDALIASYSEYDGSRTPLTFDKSTTDNKLITSLYSDHASDEKSLMQLTDADERAAGLHGLELMLADSIRAEMARQVSILELDPQQADRVLPRVDRLRQLREARLAKAEEYLSQRQEELLAGGAEALGAGTPSATVRSASSARPGADPIHDRFVVIEADTRDIYASELVHRSPKVMEAVVQKEADLQRMAVLASRIDSLQAQVNEMPRTRERDKVVKSMDRLKDDLLITRTDLGQRSAYLSKQEWSTATDSLRGLEKELARKGLAPTEPLLVMQRGMKNDAQAWNDQAGTLRKKADRTEDIIVRDSLYRQAYELELRSLRELDRSLTVANYLMGEQHMRGETLVYSAVASRLFGSSEADALVADRPVTRPTVPRSTSAAEERGDTRAGQPASEGDSPSFMDGAGEQEGGDKQDDVAQVPGTSQASRTDATQAGTGGTAPAAIAGSNAASQATERPVDEALLVRARAEAEELARREEAALDEKARRPAGLYEKFLSSDPVTMKADDGSATDDGSVLALEIQQTAARVREQEERAMALADRATVLEDSAATAKKRDRQRLESMAVRLRLEADSLQGMALRGTEQLRVSEQALVAEQQTVALKRRLVKFYYLTGDEQDLVLDDTDRSRYFSARTTALEQYDAAAEASDAARTNRTLAEALRQRTTDAPQGGTASQVAAQRERSGVLAARANSLEQRADSLDDVARRLRGAAAINESQAAVMMQGLSDADATALMALEMRTRRTEPLLAVARGQAGTQPVTTPAEPVAPATSEITETAETPRALDRSEDAIPTMERRGAAPAERATPIPAKLVTDIFELRPATERRAEAIAIDAPMPEGIVFKVQIGAFRNALPEETFSDMTPVMGESVGNGLVRYTAGLFTTFDQAAGAKDKVRDRGYRDAFVVAYRNGQRIPLGEAMREVRGSEDVAAVPATRPSTPTERSAAVTQGSTIADAPAVTEGRVGTDVPASRTATTPAPAPVTATIERPSTATVATPTPEEEVATILAKYPASATEIVDRFVPEERAAEYYNVPGAAPARQVETIKGLFFTVQVGVYSKPVALDKLFNITPLNSELTETGKIRYTTGLYLDTEQARIRKDGTVQLGVKDAFVTAYLNGKRIPMREAAALLERFGPEILAKP